MYAIIDIETTGLNARKDRITEIAIFIHNGEKIVDQFETLINPECRIPYHITAMTGISNKMVAEAPHFYEVAKRIVEMTDGNTFVAHNAMFDYNFIRCEFKRLLYDYSRKTLCTKKLSRKLMPGLKSYGLGSLAKFLDIKNKARHRAAGDALATVELLEHLMRIERNIENIPLKGLNSNLSPEIIKDLPEVPGVYYFHDESGNILYIGKSVNIKSRVMSHFSNNDHKRELELREKTASITYEPTGSDLVASLLESAEIKKYKPVFNRSLRRSLFQYGLYSHTGSDGYIHLAIESIKGDKLPLTSYGSRKEGVSHLQRLLDEFNLCQKLCGLYSSKGSCFDHHMGICRGACVGAEPPSSYNDRVIDAISRYAYRNKNFFIVDDGRFAHECSVVKVENGRFIGFGYVELNEIGNQSRILHDIIKPFEDNRDAHVIIRGYLRKNQFEKMIVY
ncbi:MAG TPA: exonuclease domain-containing protein [Bacteroidales bacterium]|nr:exonuclease domain-containing protein [Bacteroidales bacterium]